MAKAGRGGALNVCAIRRFLLGKDKCGVTEPARLDSNIRIPAVTTVANVKSTPLAVRLPAATASRLVSFTQLDRQRVDADPMDEAPHQPCGFVVSRRCAAGGRPGGQRPRFPLENELSSPLYSPAI
jgi:hypothetical protein